METVKTLAELDKLKQNEEAVLFLFGGKDCQVCHAIKPKLMALMLEHYPEIKLIYIDCHLTTDICSQNGVLSLPTLQVYFSGQKFIEEVRTFSVQKVVNKIARPYNLCFSI